MRVPYAAASQAMRSFPRLQLPTTSYGEEEPMRRRAVGGPTQVCWPRRSIRPMRLQLTIILVVSARLSLPVVPPSPRQRRAESRHAARIPRPSDLAN